MRSLLPQPRVSLGVQSLRLAFPDDHRRWVTVGATLAATAYGAVCLTRFWTGTAPSWTEATVFLFALLALVLVRASRVQLAAWLLIASVLVELMYSYAVSSQGIRMIGGFAAPAFIVGVSLFVGPRGALIMTPILSVGIPLMAWLGGMVGTSPPLTTADLPVAIVLVASINAAALLLQVFLRSFGRVVDLSRHHARQAEGLVEASPDGVLALASDGTICAINNTAEQLLDLRRDDVVGRRLKDISASLDPHVLAIERASPAPREIKLGSDMVLEVLSRRLPPGAEPITTLCVLRDITLRREAEAQYDDLQERLHHAQKLEAIGRLAGGVAHDFNNLLTAIGSHADVLVESSEPEVREIAQELLAVRSRGSALTRQLLAFARREVVQPRPIDVRRVVQGSEMLLRRLLGESIELRLDLEPSPIVADPGHVEQVVINLAANARDAMPLGGALEIRCRKDGHDSIELRIKDTGHGMDPATRELVFEPFFTTKPLGQGSGLGLSTVHGIVTQYQGSIELDTVPGEGTTFTIRWPRGPEPALSGRVPAPNRRPASGGTVLLVEDDVAARRGVRRLLRQAGYDVVEAGCPKEALALEPSVRPHLLLTDIVMPGMTGLQLAAAWAERQPGVPVLFISGYSEDALHLELGESDLLRKPFSREKLVGLIERKLGHSEPPLQTTQPAAANG